jgi:hypothetical protein
MTLKRVLIFSLPLFLLLDYACAKAQQVDSDWLVLKKNGKTVKTYMPGARIEFLTTNKTPVSGVVYKLRNDTLYLIQFDIRMMPTQTGGIINDTLTQKTYPYLVKYIGYIPKQKESFRYVKNGTIFMIGGGAYAGLHLINAAILSEPVDWKVVGIAGGVFAFGFLLRMLHKDEITIGNKYTLETVSMRTK